VDKYYEGYEIFLRFGKANLLLLKTNDYGL